MLTSTRRGISYPNPDRSDRPDIPAHIINLINASELDVVYVQNTNAARLAATHMAGVLWRETDTTLFYWDTGSTWVPLISGVTYRKTTVKDVNTTAAAVDLLNGEITIGAGVMGTDRVAIIRAWGDYLNNTGVDKQITIGVKYGATYMWKTQSGLISTSTVRRPWFIQAVLAAQGLTNAQTLGGHFDFDLATSGTVAGIGGLSPGGTGGGAGQQSGTFFGTAAEDSTAAKALALEVTHSASSASVSMRLEGAFISIS